MQAVSKSLTWVKELHFGRKFLSGCLWSRGIDKKRTSGGRSAAKLRARRAQLQWIQATFQRLWTWYQPHPTLSTCTKPLILAGGSGTLRLTSGRRPTRLLRMNSISGRENVPVMQGGFDAGAVLEGTSVRKQRSLARVATLALGALLCWHTSTVHAEGLDTPPEWAPGKALPTIHGGKLALGNKVMKAVCGPWRMAG